MAPLLVGGFNPSEKYWSVGIIIPNIWKHKKMFQTTNQLYLTHFFESFNKVKLQ